jgi:hypothetical protein
MIESALEWQLKLLRWQLFVTLTWDSVELTTGRSRVRHSTRWIEKWALVFGLSINEVAYVTRWERGEAGDRPHCHMLICGLPKSAVHLNTCFRLKNRWEQGISQVRLYEPSAGGEAYMTKGKFSWTWAQGANAYELHKFNSRELDALYISPRAMRLMLAKRGAVETLNLHS